MVKRVQKAVLWWFKFLVYIRLHRKSIYLPTAWYLAPERSPDGVSRLLQSKSADPIAKSTQKPGGFRIPPRPPQTSSGTPLHPLHLAVCRQFNFNYDIFVIHFCKYKDFAKILFLPPLANNKTGNVVSSKSFCLAFFKKLAEFETESQGFERF